MNIMLIIAISSTKAKFVPYINAIMKNVIFENVSHLQKVLVRLKEVLMVQGQNVANLYVPSSKAK